MKLNAPVVVFVRPQAAGNIGALSRVMSNFGCAELRLVGESPVYDYREDDPFSRMDWAMATKRGEPVQRAARWYPDLAAAVADTHVTIGSSGRSGEFERGYARPFVRPDEAFAVLQEWQSAQTGDFRWAFVIGPEDDGLSDFEAAQCQKLIRIDTADRCPSINAAMAAGCVLYHWHLYNSAVLTSQNVGKAGRGEWATAEQKERFLEYVMATVGKTQFLKYPDQEAVKARVRRWLQLAPVPVGELLFAFEIVYHLRAWGSGHFEGRDFLGVREAGNEIAVHQS